VSKGFFLTGVLLEKLHAPLLNVRFFIYCWLKFDFFVEFIPQHNVKNSLKCLQATSFKKGTEFHSKLLNHKQ
jgi:hypothetical protein